MSVVWRWRMRYSTASAGVTWSSPGARNACVRADTSTDSEAMPGVSISVIERSDDEGQSTTRRSTSSAGVSPRSTSMAPASRENGTCRGSLPSLGCSVTRYVMPSRYHVTIFVHSPASVGASSSPTSALSSVDLPAFTLPAIATRNGSSMRPTTAVSVASCGVPAYAFAADVNRSQTWTRSVWRSATGTVRDRRVEGEHLGAQSPDASELSVDVRQALGPVLLAGGHRLLCLQQRLGRRAVQLLCARREVVAQLALELADRVARLLRHRERKLVG